MALLRYAEARAASFHTSDVAAQRSLQASGSQRDTDTFDVFLSHSIRDARAIDGIRQMLIAAGLSVYVDWIIDPQLDRTHVTPKVADHLRKRMRQSEALIYVTSTAATTSKWMPWELGYFDGYRPRRVALLPLAEISLPTFAGQEYLGLYPYFEGFGRGIGIRLRSGNMLSAPSFVRKGAFVATS